ncbi:MAG: FmdB family zinc ribbon protein [bacterium]
MPTYEYVCRACGHEFEEFQSIKADPIAVCPKCRKKKVERKIGIGGAVIFKGGGFYETDYRSDSYRSGEDAEKKASEAKSEGKSDRTSETTSEGKSAKADDSNAKPDGKAASGTSASGADTSSSKTASADSSKSDAKSGVKPETKSTSKSDANQRPDAASVAAENKRIESRATHQSRIGRGIGNIVGGAKKPASGKKPSSTTKRGRGK